MKTLDGMQREFIAWVKMKNILSGSTPNVLFQKIFFINHESIESKRAYESCLINFYSVAELLVEEKKSFFLQKNSHIKRSSGLQ